MGDQDQDGLRRPVSFLVGFIVVFASISITLGVAEIGLRVVYPDLGLLQELVRGSEGGDSRSYQLRPNAQITFSGMREKLEKPVVWKVNPQGIRADHPVPPRSTKFRIATFGDSEAFGWGVSLENTFQRQMELIDPRIEVLNLAVPGYNAENIADHVAEHVPELKPDLILYLLHKNDIDPSLSRTPFLHRSYLWVLLRLATARIFVTKPNEYRESPEGLGFLASQVQRMIKTARRADIPLLIGFLHWHYRNALPPALRMDRYEHIGQSAVYKGGFRFDVMNLEYARKGYPEIDRHLTVAGYREVARRICMVISNGAENSCTPPGSLQR